MTVHGDAGTADKVVVAEDLTLPGRDLEITAETINVQDDVTVSTRLVDPVSGSSTGDSGNVSFSAPAIDLLFGCEVLAHADEGFAPGDVTLQAESVVTTKPIDLFFTDVGLMGLTGWFGVSLAPPRRK